MHSTLEKFILGEEWDRVGDNHISMLARDMSRSMIENGLSKIDELWGVEVNLLAKELYAGTSDAVGVHDGDEAIMDFKTPKTLKKKDQIEDYFLQGCAYALAHNEMFGTSIRKVAILMVDRSSKFADFVIQDDEFNEYCDKWHKRVIDYLTITEE